MPELPQTPFRPAIAGAIVAAMAASVCCVVPLILVLLGVSGAWISNLTALDAWRPWMIAATLACLGAAYWSLRKAERTCDSSATCPDRSTLNRRRRILGIVTVLLAILLLFPYYAYWFF